MQTSSGSTEPRPVHLNPGALVTLQAAFPPDAKNVSIVLSSDQFPLDDVLPLVAPRPKLISLFTATSPAFAGLATKLLNALDTAETSRDAATADLSIASYNPLNPALPTRNAIIFVENEVRSGAWLKGGIVAEANPLMDGLNWQSLLVRESAELERRQTDTVILWQDKRPLIFLRESNGARQLLFNFDPSLSNAEKQPAFIVLLHRFAESIRAAKIAPLTANLETGEPLNLTAAPGIPLSIRATDPAGKKIDHADIQTANPLPGFLTITQNEQTLLTAAVHFGDPREADFSACDTSTPEETRNAAAIERHTRPDPLWRIWILVLLVALMISWKYTAAKLSPITST
jgi:hypothetical protein